MFIHSSLSGLIMRYIYMTVKNLESFSHWSHVQFVPNTVNKNKPHKDQMVKTSSTFRTYIDVFFYTNNVSFIEEFLLCCW